MTALIYPNLTALSGRGLWSSLSVQAAFLKDRPSYSPDVDPRLPVHTRLATGGNLRAANSAVLSNISVAPAPATGKLGYLRIGADVWSYQGVNTQANSVVGLANLSPSTWTYTANTVVSILGTR